VYHSVQSNLIDRPNHLICHLITCPVFLATLSLRFHRHFTSLCTKNVKENNRQDAEINCQTLRIGDGWCQLRKEKCNGPLSQFPVKTAFQIVQCQISQLFLYYVHIIYKRCIMHTTWTNLYLRMKPRKYIALQKTKANVSFYYSKEKYKNVKNDRLN